MKNKELAKIFNEISEYLEMDEVPFKPYAYQKAALTLETLKNDVEDLYKAGGLKALKSIPGVGESIAHKIEEYLTTGRIQYYEEFKKKMPIALDEIVAVEGVGPKKAKVLYEKLEVKTLEELEAAAKNHKIAPLFGFGEKTEKNLLQAIEFLKGSKGRFLLGEILPIANEVLKQLQRLPEVERLSTAGSLRRMKETIGDVDFLVISTNSARVMDWFVSLPGVVKVWGQGATKSSVRLKEGFDMDIRVIPPESYGAALQYFTGSKEHNIALRKIAIDRGYKLSEYGLFQGAQMIAAQTEEEVYEKLGMPWIPPELREDRGETRQPQGSVGVFLGLGGAHGGRSRPPWRGSCPRSSATATSRATCTCTVTGTAGPTPLTRSSRRRWRWAMNTWASRTTPSFSRSSTAWTKTNSGPGTRRLTRSTPGWPGRAKNFGCSRAAKPTSWRTVPLISRMRRWPSWILSSPGSTPTSSSPGKK
jgi:DNA polymerase (family 10)